MTVNYLPEGYSLVTPFISVPNASGLIEFLSKAFGFQTRLRMDTPSGEIGHAEVALGNSVLMVADPDERAINMPACVHLYVEEVDRTYKAALEAGATSETEPETHFYGDRSATVVDQWGNRWFISTHVEDVSDEEMRKRAVEAMNA